MRKIALLLCIIIALGWVSDAGLLSLKIGDTNIKGIPTEVGYRYTIYFDKWATTYLPLGIAAAIDLGWKPLVLINGKILPVTRLGNGWLFKFKEVEGTFPLVGDTK